MMSSTEDYREQLREWREDGGRHSDEVRRNPEQTYFRGSTGIFCILFYSKKEIVDI